MNTEVSQENKKLAFSNNTQHQKTLPPLKVNDSVRLHDRKIWTITGKIIKKINDISRSYLIETNKGMLRRNRQYILLDPGRKSYKSRTIDNYGSTLFTRETDVSNDPTNTSNTNNESNNENVKDKSPHAFWKTSDTANSL